jgi:hypothetical protein
MHGWSMRNSHSTLPKRRGGPGKAASAAQERPLPQKGGFLLLLPCKMQRLFFPPWPYGFSSIHSRSAKKTKFLTKEREMHRPDWTLGARRAVEKTGDGWVGQYLDGGERRLVEALEVAAHLPLPQKLPPPLLQRRRPGIPRRRRRSSLEEERRRHGERHQTRPRRRHGHPARAPQLPAAGQRLA